jgi:hypothetical protein
MFTANDMAAKEEMLPDEERQIPREGEEGEEYAN